jgi:hypothetical protein
MNPIVVDIIADVVNEVRQRWDWSEEPTMPYFFHGHIEEIVNIWIERGKIQKPVSQKFPAIVLVQDFPEKMTDNIHEATLTILILTNGKQMNKAAQRYDDTFKPTLYPLMQLFFEELVCHRNINQAVFNYTKTDRLYWGTNNKNTGTDFIDAIEISNLNVNFLNTCKK